MEEGLEDVQKKVEVIYFPKKCPKHNIPYKWANDLRKEFTEKWCTACVREENEKRNARD